MIRCVRHGERPEILCRQGVGQKKAILGIGLKGGPRMGEKESRKRVGMYASIHFQMTVGNNTFCLELTSVVRSKGSAERTGHALKSQRELGRLFAVQEQDQHKLED